MKVKRRASNYKKKPSGLFWKKIDIILLIVFPILSVALSLVLKANLLVSVFFFFGLPAMWFSLRTPTQVAKTFIFALVAALPISTIVDYIATRDGAWLVPVTMFPFRVFGIVPIENLLFAFSMIYYIIIFYEHFLDKGKQELVDKHLKYLVWPALTIFFVFCGVVLFYPLIPVPPYAYLWMGVIIMIIPTVTFLSFFPALLSKYTKVGAYFFLLFLMFELTALELKQWEFPGAHFIGWVQLGPYRFPFEEFFFWCMMTAVGILSYYEFFDGDRK